MKFLLSSDWHVDATTAGVERFEDLDAYVEKLLERLDVGDIDVFVFLGDAFDPGSPHESRWASKFARAARAINERTRIGSIWLAGNHDVLEISEKGIPVTTLSTIKAMTDNNGDTFINSSGVLRVVELPECIEVGVGDKRVAVLALPYVARSVMSGTPYAEAEASAFDLARAIGNDDGPVLVFGHLSFNGMTPGSEAEMLRGRDVMFPLEQVLQLRPTFVANGHYHAREVINRGGLTIQIVGSPMPFTFGERADGDHGFTIVEV